MHNYNYQDITLGKVLKIFQKTFNKVDHRLLGHGEHVAYVIWKMLSYKGGYDDKKLSKLVSLAFFHDMGAFKTEEIDKMTEFEVTNFLEHSIYGSLYIKYFSPLSEFWEIILYHHVNYENSYLVTPDYREETFIIKLADRISILMNHLDAPDYSLLYKFKDRYFAEKHIDLFAKVDKEENLLGKLRDGSYKDELYSFLDNFKLPLEDVVKFSKMLVYSIDFRSPVTVTHTISVTTLSTLISKKLNFSEIEIKNISYAAMVHDIGKITTPISILEKPGTLTDEEMDIMKEHVSVTYEILNDFGFNYITEIASYHHEKLDGTGYPFGLTAKELSIEARIVAVADILSALIGVRSYKKELPKAEVIAILTSMAKHNKIDSHIVDIVIENYDELIYHLNIHSRETLGIYKRFHKDYMELIKSISIA